MSEYIIQVKNARKYFHETKALDDVTLDFEKNKIHGLVGRNGSGKTVLLKAICGLLKLTGGEIVVDGKVIGKDIEIPSNVGAIIETPGFINEFSGYENLRFLAGLQGKIGKKRIVEVLEVVGLDAASKKKVGKYSLGMKQRLGIAQAIMENPDILILDEPTNGLDKQGVKDFYQMILDEKRQGKTIILASHNAVDIELLCDYVYELDAGKLQRI
ncbi:MAG: ATP-binding cassette domain-containing protein [Lachnospiraceae bacterium]|nr:ATP-binding cassette domain-containing protein [Lachnospiraceae bacterium]